MPNYLNKITTYLAGLYSLGKEDKLLISFPKSGNTWLRFIIANIINELHPTSEVVTFRMVDEMMPEFGVNNLNEKWNYNFPRFIKSHWKYNVFFKRIPTLLIIRDPRDVMISYYHYLQARKKNPYTGSFKDFIRESRYGLRAWFIHTKGWQTNATAIIKYEELKENPLEELKKSFSALRIIMNDNVLKVAIAKSEFKKIKQEEQEFGHSKEDFFADNKSFFRKGNSKEWNDYFEDDDIDLYRSLQKEYNNFTYS